MKFKKRERYEPKGFSDRAKAAWLAKPQRQRKKLEAAAPLLADLVDTSNQLSPEAEAARRLALQIKTEQEWRNREARNWREARALYFSLPMEQRREVMRRWNNWKGHHKSQSLNYIIREVNGENERIRQKHLAYERDWRIRVVQEMAAQPFLPFAGEAA